MKPSRLPIILSAMFPGSGQIMQGRWAAAFVFLSSFMALFCVFMWAALRIIISFYKLGFEFNTAEVVEVHAASFLLPLFLALVVWFVNLIDAFVAYQRASTAYARRRLSGSI